MRMRKLGRDWLLIAAVMVFAASCSGGGCGGCGSLGPIPGGFPVAKRNPNAIQVRVSQSGLAATTANPAAVVGTLIGSGNGSNIQFDVPGSCGSPGICCTNNMVTSPCGPLNIDLTKHMGDADRLDIVPDAGSDAIDVTLRARVNTVTDVQVTEGLTCGLNLDTTRGSTPDMVVTMHISFVQDATALTTRLDFGTPTVSLEKADIVLESSDAFTNVACEGADYIVTALLTQVEGLIADQLTGPLQSALCKACPDGTVDECGQYADSCMSNVCYEGSGSGTCVEELGLDGRMPGSSLFGSFSPGTTGALDLYAVAGGYATTDSNGIALGLLGGMEPGGSARDRCGPIAPPPAVVNITPSEFFEGNTRPDTGAAFDVALGLHKSQLDQFAYAAYDGGLLCLTITHDTVAELSTGTLTILARSLANLNAGPAPMAVGLRPQSPPVITLGHNTFTTNGSDTTVDDPLLDIKFTGMELDFFAAVSDQYIRVFTVVADVDLPVGLQVNGMGELAPVLGDVSHAFTNLTVKNSQAVTESPAQLAALFPSILSLVLPQLSGGLGTIALPSLGGLQLSVDDITSVPQTHGGSDLSYLAIFASLTTATAADIVDTTAQLAAVDDADAADRADPLRWADARQPTITLALAATGAQPSDLEYSYRLDHGLWSAWSKNAHPTIKSNILWLAGPHHVDVRARRIGHPETIDPTPAAIDVTLGGPDAGASAPRSAPFHGTTNGAGCACDSSGAPAGSAVFAVIVMIGVFVPRRWKLAALLAGLVAIPNLGCGSKNPCGSAKCMDGDLARGALGQWTSIAGDDKRVMVATYDQGLGDLVAVDVTDPANRTYVAVDGIPTDVTPTYQPSSYRGGIADAGPNVGAWTSIILSGGTARIAYQDLDAHALKYAYEQKDGTWASYVIDPGSDGEVGQYASMIVDSAGNPAIAYLALGVDGGSGVKTTELRLARNTSANPQEGDWYSIAVASRPGTCAGLCDPGQMCVAGVAATDPQQCVATSGTCSPACGSGDVCVANACRTPIADPTVSDIPTGIGLFVHLVTLSDGRLVLAYYDRDAASLAIAVEQAGSTDYLATYLDGGPGLDRGMWCSAVVDPSDRVHLSYQDALGDQLMYTTWDSATGTIGVPQVVDDGERTGDRPHNVGASSQIYLNNGTPEIAYQDGLTADLDRATLAGTTWATTDVGSGDTLDGFSISVTTAHGGTPIYAWDQLDVSQTPPNDLQVQSP